MSAAVLDVLGARAFPGLAEARAVAGHGARLRAIRQAAEATREALQADGPVEGLSSHKLITFPYPAGFAFSGAALSPAPYVMMTNRVQVVQYRDHHGARRTLIFNPSDYERGQRAPFFATLRERYGDFIAQKVMSTRHGTVASVLEANGLRPADIDFIAFDHLHVQDLRGWLGGDGAGPAYFPRAKLLVQRAEWEAARDLHPMQRVWYVPEGTAGVPAERVVLLDGDAWLGKGVAIVSTPGHTFGNMSLAVAADGGRGVYVISENAVATEALTPEHCAIPGVRSHAEHLGLEVVLNGNTREHSLDQYSSMVLEKVLAGPAKLDGRYVNFYPSSELSPSLLAPGLSPGFSHGDVSSGAISAPLR